MLAKLSDSRLMSEHSFVPSLKGAIHMKDAYIHQITELLHTIDDIDLLDFVYKLLVAESRDDALDTGVLVSG